MAGEEKAGSAARACLHAACQRHEQPPPAKKCPRCLLFATAKPPRRTARKDMPKAVAEQRDSSRQAAHREVTDKAQ